MLSVCTVITLLPKGVAAAFCAGHTGTWRGHTTNPCSASGWKASPCTKLLMLRADDSMWHDRWITVQETAGHCAPQVCRDPKSLRSRDDWSWLSILWALFAACCSPKLPVTSDAELSRYKEKTKAEPHMLLLGAEQLACITFAFQLGQLVTKHESTGIINSRLLASSNVRFLLEEIKILLADALFAAFN